LKKPKTNNIPKGTKKIERMKKIEKQKKSEKPP